MPPLICQSWLDCLNTFQVLLSGILAVIAAVLTATVIWISARLPVQSASKERIALNKRRHSYVKALLSAHFATLSARARQAEGTIRNIIGANGVVTDQVKQKVKLTLSPLVDDWESISLLPPEIQSKIATLRRKIEDHNFDMDRAAGAFGADNFRQHILTQIKSVQGYAAAVSAQIEVSKLPEPLN